MQLLIILALLMYGGKSGAQNLLSEVKPVLESIGGEEMRQALKSAEEISSVLSAVKEISGANVVEAFSPAFAGSGSAEEFSSAREEAIAFPLAPVNDIADKDITYCLSKYISSQA